MRSSVNGHESVVRLLLDHHADVNVCDKVRHDVSDYDDGNVGLV